MGDIVEFNELKKSRLLRNSDEIDTFEKTIESILELEDVNHIEVLCEGFDDSTENPEVMFGLIHAIESYDNIAGSDISLRVLANSIPKMLPHANEWLKILHKRILNHKPSMDNYKKIVTTLDSDIQKQVVSQLVDIKVENPSRFGKNVDAILDSIQ